MSLTAFLSGQRRPNPSSDVEAAGPWTVEQLDPSDPASRWEVITTASSRDDARAELLLPPYPLPPGDLFRLSGWCRSAPGEFESVQEHWRVDPSGRARRLPPLRRVTGANPRESALAPPFDEDRATDWHWHWRNVRHPSGLFLLADAVGLSRAALLSAGCSLVRGFAETRSAVEADDLRRAADAIEAAGAGPEGRGWSGRRGPPSVRKVLDSLPGGTRVEILAAALDRLRAAEWSAGHAGMMLAAEVTRANGDEGPALLWKAQQRLRAAFPLPAILDGAAEVEAVWSADPRAALLDEALDRGVASVEQEVVPTPNDQSFPSSELVLLGAGRLWYVESTLWGARKPQGYPRGLNELKRRWRVLGSLSDSQVDDTANSRAYQREVLLHLAAEAEDALREGLARLRT